MNATKDPSAALRAGMIESVARALYELEPLTSMGNGIPWEAITSFGRDPFERRARTAIAAHTAALSATPKDPP